MNNETASALREQVRRRFFLRHRPPLAMTMSLPLLGVMLALVFFLLPFFSSSGEVCGCGIVRGVHLPLANGGEELESAPIVGLGPDGIVLNGLSVDRFQLFDDLVTLQRNFELQHPGEAWSGKVLVYADRDLPVGAVKELLRLLEEAGYGHRSLVVENSVL